MVVGPRRSLSMFVETGHRAFVALLNNLFLAVPRYPFCKQVYKLAVDPFSTAGDLLVVRSYVTVR